MNNRTIRQTQAVPDKNRLQPSHRLTAGWGAGGGRLKGGLPTLDLPMVPKGFAVSASPSRFLWFVSCAGTRNEHPPSF